MTGDFLSLAWAESLPARVAFHESIPFNRISYSIGQASEQNGIHLRTAGNASAFVRCPLAFPPVHFQLPYY